MTETHYDTIGLTEEKFAQLLTDIHFQISNNVKSQILMTEWREFVEFVSESAYELEEKDRYGYYLNCGGVRFDTHQTRFTSDYLIGGKEQGYGFNSFQCISCGATSLQYDSKEKIYYCSGCEGLRRR